MIQTIRCVIDKIQPSDFEDVATLHMTPEVRKYLGGVRQIDRESFLMMLDVPQSDYYWVVREKETDAFIGVVSLDCHHDSEDLEVSYQLMPSMWGRGYATEIVQAIVKFGFNVLELPKIVAETQTANIASCKMLEKIEMKLEKKIQRFGAEQAIYSIYPYK